MRIIQRGRVEGKTLELVMECLKHDGILIVMNSIQKELILKRFPDLKKNKVLIFDNDLKVKLRGKD